MTLRPARWRFRFQAEAGATAVEYALMVTFIAMVIIAAVVFLGTNLSAIFADAGANI